eukprot:TRINITY_DN2231_c0_g1_i4.p8 TRINITY_DN2231_c0_g1~~TRINITY_DN2231_c0_g1_i4.p8  ORF type:complete len:111 (+),score=9.95 TRINITY_DN2231_c0_g1_i4:1291-1623(+)
MGERKLTISNIRNIFYDYFPKKLPLKEPLVTSQNTYKDLKNETTTKPKNNKKLEKTDIQQIFWRLQLHRNCPLQDHLSIQNTFFSKNKEKTIKCTKTTKNLKKIDIQQIF